MTTTSQSATGKPCAICGYPASYVVYDYVELELNKLMQRREPICLCEAHQRLDKLYRLDGSSIDLGDIRRAMWREEWPPGAEMELAEVPA